MSETTLCLDLPDEAATKTLGARLAALSRPGDVILLNGPLGAGKSTLARAFIQSLLGEDEDVPSPTFTLVQTYDADHATLWHFDLYRLEQPQDAFELGIEDAFVDGICLIEWPQRLGGYLPRLYLDINLETAPDQGVRHVTLTSRGQWDDRMGNIAP